MEVLYQNVILIGHEIICERQIPLLHIKNHTDHAKNLNVASVIPYNPYKMMWFLLMRWSF